jgi:hypothetical protein
MQKIIITAADGYQLSTIIKKEFDILFSKKYLSILLISILFFVISCKKNSLEPPPGSAGVLRKVKFSLYTTKDFSNNNDTITFSLSIKKANNQVLWDSVFMPIKIKEIPGANNKLVVEKIVPNNDNSLLIVGFYYAIKDVGISWYLDSSSAGSTFKKVDFNF